MQNRSCLFLEHGIDIGGVESKRLQVLGGMEDGIRMSEDMCVFMALQSLWRGLVAVALPVHTSCVL